MHSQPRRRHELGERHAADLPEWALISIIEPSPHDPAVAYLAATRYKHDDFAPYLYNTADYGKSWTQDRRRHRR